MGKFFCLLATSAVAVVSSLVEPETAIAGQYRCESRELAADDEMSLRARALAALPKSARIEVLAPCRNPESAHALISTRKTVSKEGVRQWWEFTCRRDGRIWKCDAPELKQLFNMQSLVDGSAHEVELSFDKTITLDRAVNLAHAALKIYENPDAELPFCNSRAAQKSDWKQFRPHLSMPAGTISIQISVDDGKITQTVWLTDIAVAIDFGLGPMEGGELAPSCWGLEVVVA